MLPQMKVPEYETQLISNKTKVKYRPWIVSEMKTMMLTLETGTKEEVINSMVNAVDTCTFGKLDIAKLPSFELERLFMLIRTKSVGETLEIKVKCSNCQVEHPITLNLAHMEIANAEKMTNRIQLSKDYGLGMRYPTVHDMIDSVEEAGVSNGLGFYVALAKRCLTGVAQGSEFYTTTKNTKPEEIMAVLDALDTDAMSKVIAYFDNMPTTFYPINFKCEACSTENTTELKGADSFFG